MRWCSAPGAALTCREWDGQIVVFNQESGSTHLLDGFAGNVLRRLMEREWGATVDELAAALASGQDARERRESEQAVTAVLVELARLGMAHADAP
jgi:PqqD family protein of HPr-rel-A system